jgi:putative DNA primase/helicase
VFKTDGGRTRGLYTIIYDNIPEELKVIPHWVNYKREPRGGADYELTKIPWYPHQDPKLTKVPYRPNNVTADSSDPRTWSTYQACVDAFENGQFKFDGIGFEFGKSEYCGIDIDKCRNPETGEIDPAAQYLIDHLDSYTEISPSGTGIHIIVKATLPPGRRRVGCFEMYNDKRFFTVTGRTL